MPRTPQVIAQRTARLDGGVILNLLFAGLLLCASMLAAAAHAKAPPQSFADLTERLRPAVVNISTTQQVKQQLRRIPKRRRKNNIMCFCIF